MDHIGLTVSQVRRIVENILSNSPGFTQSDLLGKDVRIVATRGPTFRSFGTLDGFPAASVRIVLVTNRELGLTQPATPAETCTRAQELGLRRLTETESALMQAGWDYSNETAVQVGETLYSVDTCRTVVYHGPDEDTKATDTFGPEKQWAFVQP